MIGNTISHYRITEKLGEGGMGVVYRAEDTKLKRTVALKFLRPDALVEQEQKDRFITEAQAAAALDHSNICTIHEIDEVEGETFIVMAFVEGQTLKEKIASGPLRLEEALDLGIQMAQGLEEAHGKGIVHRDIKPANIMLTPKGQAKIMDFGLAKLSEKTAVTKEGTTLGTVGYMSPEQARGESADHRSDIWSLGVVLFEMLTGQLPFRGEYEQAIIYSILNAAPEPVTGLRSGIPLQLEQCISKCLEKNPAHRYQHADELTVDLQRQKRDTSRVIERPLTEPAVPETEAAPTTSVVTPEPVGRAIPKLRDKPLLYAGGAGLIIILAVVGYFVFQAVSGPPTPRLSNPTRFTTAIGQEGSITWSPDGRKLAYESNQSGNMDIWVKPVAGGTPVNRTSDNPGRDGSPSWSPDGSQIAFSSSRAGGWSCFVMSELGGIPRKVKDRVYDPPCWSADGKALASASMDSVGQYVEIFSLQGETLQRLRLPERGNEYSTAELSWSPDGRYFVFVSSMGRGVPTSRLWLLRLADGDCFPVTDGTTWDYNPSWSRDGRYLYFISNRGGIKDLWQQRIGKNGRPAGEPRPVTTGLETAYASFSPDGSKLAYSKGRGVSNMWRMPIPQSGTGPATWADARQLTFEETMIGGTGWLDISPDGKRVVFSSDLDGENHLWVMPVEGGEMRRVTADPMDEDWPGWSPDGREIAFSSNRSGNYDIWVVPVAGGPARQVTRHEAGDAVSTWSPDGREIAFQSDRGGNSNIWIIPAEGGQARQITDHPAMDIWPDWSPDGQWLLFSSIRSGDYGIWRVPVAGGRPEPLSVGHKWFWFGVWSKDGKKVYYSSWTAEAGNTNVWEVPVEGGAERQLTDLTGKYGRMGSHPATDGKYLYFTWREGQSDLYVMDVEWE